MSEHTVEPPTRMVARLLRSAWNTTLTIYYANSVSWRVLKSGALFFFGFFLWAGSNVLLSYRPGWRALDYTLAYGFVLIFYGPFHHLVVIPVYQRLRRQGIHLSLGGHLHLPNASLAVFLALVVVLGTYPAGPMVLDFQSSLAGSGADIDPDLQCVRSQTPEGAVVHCHLTESRGIDRVAVKSGDERVLVDDDPPFEFTVRASELQEVVGEPRFRVELLDEDGELIRQYTRSLSMIRET